MAIQQVEELGLQRRTRTPRVEIGQKRILHLLEHERRIEPGSETLSQ
jgi:hypothetical protein